MKIGFIGVGRMGRAMSKNLLNAGYELIIYDIDKQAVRHLVSLGARAAKSPREMAEESEVILACLPSPRALEEVILGDEGVLKAAQSGSVLIDLGTTDPETIKRIARYATERGVEVLDAPVSGGTEGAEAGTLSIMVGGKREVFQGYFEVFRCIGEKIHYVGELGSGSLVKIVNNLMSSCNTVAMVEGLALGVKAGMDPETLYKVIKESSGFSRSFESRWARRIAKGDYDPGFTINLVRKDLGLAFKMGKELDVPLFMTHTADQVYSLAQSKGLHERDTSCIALFYEDLLKIKLGMSKEEERS
ncbi:MAG: NAD-binding protein [Nitrososphaeria archaeon]|nr:NAD-binding protein [Nitrososphaeria archaeon]NIQ32752.1 NAD-binding protein [Nitrososphaeria archaeon]